MEKQVFIHNRIIEDMSEGVLTIGFDGIVESANRAALTIMEKESGELVGLSFARVFLTDERNDAFVQCVLDAVYGKGQGQEGYAVYQGRESLKHIRGERASSICGSFPPICETGRRLSAWCSSSAISPN